ncbi:LOW QUALITY PROTEIN: SHC-transforming protein 4-like [Lampris incognitus]|uniref:LOW QUALITY PROTEIN: SHC-transforming protein 4-like n=1 Tax=Lampris incognitus TaxID=2546036 RepID=UPI0024B55F9E|nr:LOW QUALITY PROTEIN: SHC-transforming protein 4-like [Lampris incognitus]
MLQRTKYSRLRNDSLTSQEDWPQGALPLKGDLCVSSDPSPLDSRTLPDQDSSTLRGFIPRMANIKLHSPVSLLGVKGQTNRHRHKTIDEHTDRPLSRTEWTSRPNQRLCSQTSLPLPPTHCHNQNHSTLHCIRRPITLHRIASLPWTPGCPPRSHRDRLSCLKTSSAAEECTTVGQEKRAVHHHLKYMGSLEVTQSMKTLDFNTRMQVTREAISRLCERTRGAKTAVKNKRPLHKGLSAVLGQHNLRFSGRSVILTVFPDSVTLITACSLQTIAHHPMPSISFASGGDPDMADFIAYVAKDPVNRRVCYILECPQGQACEVINSIGQAFETCFHQLLSHAPSTLPAISRSAVGSRKWSLEDTMKDHEGNKHNECRDYYNVIPGKTPPIGGVQDMRLSGGADDADAGMQEVSSSEPVSLYENRCITEQTLAPSAVTSNISGQQRTAQTDSENLSEKLIQDWLGREQAESLLTCSGDFLVRESSSTTGQYVLSGMEGATVRHLLLVRTRDQVFLSIWSPGAFPHGEPDANHFWSIELCLRQPILQRH